MRTDLQLPRAADEPGRRRPASCSASPTAATRRRSPRPWSGSAASGRWSSAPTTALDEISDRRSHPRDRGRRRRHRGVVRRPRGPRHRARGPRATIAGGEPRGERRRRPRACSPASEGPARDVVVLNAGAAILAAGGAARSRARRSSGPARRSTPAPRAGCSSGWSRLTARARGLSRDHLPCSAHEQARGARGGSEGGRGAAQAAACRSTTLRESIGTLSGSRPFSEALVRPGLSLIAEFKRRSPSAGEIAGRRQRRRRLPGLRARRRGGALGAHRRAQLRRHARRPARGPGRLRPADPAQGLHRRPVPALRGGGQRRRRGAADRRRARRRQRCATSTRRRGCSTSTAWSRSTTRRSSSGRWRSTPT